MTQWKLVPCEPTLEMAAVFIPESCKTGSWIDGYKAMLAAAPAPDVQPVAWMNPDPNMLNLGYEKFSKHSGGGWDIPVYAHPPAADVQPVAWSVFDKRTQKHWYTNESVNTAGYYAKEYSHREPDGSPSMLVVPLYEHPPAAAPDLYEVAQAIIDAVSADESLHGILLRGIEPRARAAIANATGEGK